MRWIGVAFLFLATSVSGAQPTAPRVRIVEELRLDATVEDFPTVSSVYVGPRGEILVPISQDLQLRAYDARGRKIGATGRRGAGPGEFHSIASAGFHAGSLWVQDIRLQRATWFDQDFEFVRTQPWPQSPRLNSGRQIGLFTPLAVRRDGSVLGRGLLLSEREEDRRYPPSVFAVASPSGDLRQLVQVPSMADEPSEIWIADLGNRVPFALRPLHAVAPDGGRIVRLTAPIPDRMESSFTVTLFGADGDTLFSRAYPYRGTPIPRQSADSAIAAMVSRRGEGPTDLDLRFQALARERMPRWYIAPETITLGLDQTIWIGMRPTDEGRGYLILNGSGDPIGSLMVPASIRVRQASATHIWVTETDDDGLSSVVRYRVLGVTGNGFQAPTAITQRQHPASSSSTQHGMVQEER